MNRTLVIALTLAIGVAPAAAQQGRSAQPPSRGTAAPAAKPAEPPPPPETPAPPYEKDLLRLSEIVGSLAFLRTLCPSSDAGEWPKRMQALLDTEGTTPGRRERLAGAYNRGYRGYALMYRTCTQSATDAA